MAGEHDDSDDDILMDLLSYDCPFTGAKRTAGMLSSDLKPPKPLGEKMSIRLPLWYFKISKDFFFRRKTGMYNLHECTSTSPSVLGP